MSRQHVCMKCLDKTFWRQQNKKSKTISFVHREKQYNEVKPFQFSASKKINLFSLLFLQKKIDVSDECFWWERKTSSSSPKTNIKNWIFPLKFGHWIGQSKNSAALEILIGFNFSGKQKWRNLVIGPTRKKE